MSTNDRPQQLVLLPSSVPAQFRLDAETRRRGLRHIAEIRQMLAAREAARAAAERAVEAPRLPSQAA